MTPSSITLVKKELATATFGYGIRGKVLAHTAIGQSLGSDEPADIANRTLTSEVPLAKKRRTVLVKKLLEQ